MILSLISYAYFVSLVLGVYTYKILSL